MSEETASPIIAGDAAILARRYAGALYDLATEQKLLDVVAGDLRGLDTLRHESAEFKYIAQQPRLTRPQLIDAMQQISKASGANALTANFIALLAKHRRLDHLGAIIHVFLSRLATSRGEFTAEVKTASKLSEGQEQQLASKLGALAGGKVNMTITSDPSLLGGLTVKMGSRLIDASVRSKLERLERQLKTDNTTLEGAA